MTVLFQQCIRRIPFLCMLINTCCLFFFFLFFTKLLLVLWGEPHRNKKRWEGVTPSPPGEAQRERGYLRGGTHSRDRADSGRRACLRSRTESPQARPAGLGGLAPGTRAKGEGVGHEAAKLLGFLLLLLVCLFLLLLLLLLHDLRVPLLAGAAESPSSRRFPLTESLCFFIFFWRASLRWLPQVTASIASPRSGLVVFFIIAI